MEGRKGRVRDRRGKEKGRDKATKRGVEGFTVVVRKGKDRRINSIKEETREEGGNLGVLSRSKS